MKSGLFRSKYKAMGDLLRARISGGKDKWRIFASNMKHVGWKQGGRLQELNKRVNLVVHVSSAAENYFRKINHTCLHRNKESLMHLFPLPWITATHFTALLQSLTPDRFLMAGLCIVAAVPP